MTTNYLGQVRMPVDGTIIARKLVGPRIPACHVQISAGGKPQMLVLDPDACVTLYPGLRVTKKSWATTLRIGPQTLPALPWLTCWIAACCAGGILIVGIGLTVWPQQNHREAIRR
jgi:hypothetical protein